MVGRISRHRSTSKWMRQTKSGPNVLLWALFTDMPNVTETSVTDSSCPPTETTVTRSSVAATGVGRKYFDAVILELDLYAFLLFCVYRRKLRTSDTILSTLNASKDIIIDVLLQSACGSFTPGQRPQMAAPNGLFHIIIVSIIGITFSSANDRVVFIRNLFLFLYFMLYFIFSVMSTFVVK